MNIQTEILIRDIGEITTMLKTISATTEALATKLNAMATDIATVEYRREINERIRRNNEV